MENLLRLLDDPSIKKTGEDLSQKLIDLEMNLIDLRLTGAQDGTRYGSKLLSKLNYLANGLASGDFKPTNQQTEVQKVLEERLKSSSSQFDSLLAKDLAGFNDLLRKKNIGSVIPKTP